MPLDTTTSPFGMSKDETLQEALDKMPQDSSVLDKTHALVWGVTKYAIYNPNQLQMFAADTGLGKTTGFRNAIKKAWDTMWQEMPVLILVPTRHDAEKMYLEMEEIEEGCAAVWTMSHDPEQKELDENFIPVKYFAKHEASQYKCLILTHNAGKVAEKWIGRRDIVFVDEYSDPVMTKNYELYQFTKARDDESSGPYGDLFQDAEDWAREQEEHYEQGDKRLTPVVIPSWIDTILTIAPTSEEGRNIQGLASAIKERRVFQTRTTRTTWTAYDYNVPFQEKSIMFSATAMFDGWQFGENSDFLKEHLPVIDYSDVTFKHKAWPEGVPVYHDKILSNRQHREEFFDYLKEWIQWPNSETLIIAPKPFVSDIKAMFPMVKVTNYGRDVGSNDFRDCTAVYVVSEFHKPSDVARSHYLGHSGALEVTEDALEPISNTQGATMLSVKDANYCVHLKQMIARCALRNIDDDGKAGKATVHCMINEDRYTRLLPMLFPQCNLTFPEGKARIYERRDNTPIVAKIIHYLRTVPEDQEFVGSPELRESGIWIKGASKVKQIAIGEPNFLGSGWYFRKGNSRTNPAGFHRLKG